MGSGYSAATRAAWPTKAARLSRATAPRFTTTSDTIEVTNRILRSTERELQARGYPTHRHAFSYMMPTVHGIRIVDGQLDGGADPSGDGMAAQV